MSENGFEDSQVEETSPEVYRRRRIVALIALLLVVLLLIWGIVSLFRAIGGGSEDAKATAAASTSTSAEPFSDFSERASASASADSDSKSDSDAKESASASANSDSDSDAQASASAQADADASASSKAVAEAEASASAAAAIAAQAEADASASAAAEAAASASASASPAAVVACSAADMSVALTVDQNSYAAGQYPAMAVTYTNTSGTPCNVGGAGNVVDINIISGPAQVYNYAQCNAAASTETSELAAGATGTKVVTWDRSLNVLGCGTGYTIQPGYYWATATVNGVASTPTRIIVTG